MTREYNVGVGSLDLLKETFHIERLKPELNKQVDYVSLALHLNFYRNVS